MNLNRKLKKILQNHVVDYIGFADISVYNDELINFGGKIVEGYKNAISIGLVIPDSIVGFLPERENNNISCEYRIHGYEVLNNRLNVSASVVSSYLNKKGFRTLPVPAADRTDEKNAVPTVSHKMIAHIAGMGWIGKNCLLITPNHGPRVRFVTVLTDAPLNSINKPMEQLCDDCQECVNICPVNAVKGKNYIAGESREVRLDFLKCEKYFDVLKKQRKYAVCGMCLFACPYGKKVKK